MGEVKGKDREGREKGKGVEEDVWYCAPEQHLTIVLLKFDKSIFVKPNF